MGGGGYAGTAGRALKERGHSGVATPGVATGGWTVSDCAQFAPLTTTEISVAPPKSSPFRKMATIPCQNIDPALLTFGDVATNAKGGKSVSISGDQSGNRLVVQFGSGSDGKMRAPFGLSAPMQTQTSDDPTRKLQVEVDGVIRSQIEAIEARVVAVATERSLAWFKKEMDVDQVRGMFHSCLRAQTDAAKYPKPLFSVKVRISGDRPTGLTTTTGAEEPDDEPALGKRKLRYSPTVPASEAALTRGSHVIVIARCVGVYFINRASFGLSWACEDLLLFPEPDVPRGAKAFKLADAVLEPQAQCAHSVKANPEPPVEADEEFDPFQGLA
jgi:hypothetical protein